MRDIIKGICRNCADGTDRVKDLKTVTPKRLLQRSGVSVMGPGAALTGFL
jgi:hypothetical protein